MGTTRLDDLPWEAIQEISEKGLFEEVYKRIPHSLFSFAADEKNYTLLVSSAKNSLQRRNPEATVDQAVILADVMQQFARNVLKRKNI